LIVDLAINFSREPPAFVGDSNGICNSIYVDNVVHAIACACMEIATELTARRF